MPWIARADERVLGQPSKLSDFRYFPVRGASAVSGMVKFGENGQLLETSDLGDAVQSEDSELVGLLVQASQNRFEILLPCMRDIGLHRIYCRTDGGHDDSFSWISHAFLEDGTKVGPEGLCELMAGSRFFSVAMRLKLSWENDHRSDCTVIHDTLEIDLCSLMWSQWSFGNTFGLGAYSFFGAYTVDLAAGIIQADPDPLPVVRHIMISQS